MSHLYPSIDPEGLLEYSVVYTDRSLNHMSQTFKDVMVSLAKNFKKAYRAEGVALVPGGGTAGMEAIVRQFVGSGDTLTLRMGWFSYRWSQIFERTGSGGSNTVLKALRVDSSDPLSPFAPPALHLVEQAISQHKPKMVFMPHVETASGLILQDSYIRRVANAAHEIDALVVLDAVASGAIFPDMASLGVDILLTAPQKGWNSSPGAGIILLSPRALTRLQQTESTSFSLNLKAWYEIMSAYERGGFAYHATLPTDSLAGLAKTVEEYTHRGLETLTKAQWDLGTRTRSVLCDFGFKSVAASEFASPSVVVCYTVRDDLQKGSRFAELGLQIAPGVPLMCDEGSDFKTFRIGLFGLEKLMHIDRSLDFLSSALQRL